MLEATISVTRLFFLRIARRKSQDKKTLMLVRQAMVSSSAEMVTRHPQTTTNFVRKTNLLQLATLICQLKYANLRPVSRIVMTNCSSRERILNNQRSQTALSVVKMLTTLLRRMPLRSTLKLCNSKMTTSLESLTNSVKWTSMYATSSIAEVAFSDYVPATSKKSVSLSTVLRMPALVLPNAGTE